MPPASDPSRRGLIVAAPATGSGKTLITLGLLRALRRADRRVAAFKTGPDYIDPAFHGAALGQDEPCINLDGWAMDDAALGHLLARHAAGAELLIGEGVMGLFDGARGVMGPGDGSTADLAARLGVPVVLVADARGQGASLAALIAGFVGHRPDISVAGVILNRIAGDSHAALLRDAIARLPRRITVLGAVPSDAALALPSRHLGLVQAREYAGLDALIERAAGHIAAHVDLAALAAVARPLRDLPAARGPLLPPPGRRIALARDDAFAFAYPAVIAGWHDAGCEIAPFSPLADEAPDATADAVALPGGYPELHAGRLAAARTFLDGLRAAAARGATVYGECGGYMVLGESLTDAAGTVHAMAGLLPLAASFADRKLHLGYRRVALCEDAPPLGSRGARFRGHEFHYATVLREGAAAPLFAARDAAGNELGRCGLRRGRVMGSFIHLLVAAQDG